MHQVDASKEARKAISLEISHGGNGQQKKTGGAWIIRKTELLTSSPIHLHTRGIIQSSSPTNQKYNFHI